MPSPAGHGVVKHDAARWRQRWDAAIRTTRFHELRDLRLEVQKQTCTVLQQGVYLADAHRVVLPQPEVASSIWQDVDASSGGGGGDGQALVFVAELDCLRACELLKRRHGDDEAVAVLNMANQYTPGGGWKSGCGAQEENLFRRTDLMNHLLSGVEYPLPEFGGAFSANVTVFRGTEAEGYPLLDSPFKVNVISVAACVSPPVIGGRLRDDYAEKTRRKIRMIFFIARETGVRHIVVSAFGCGAFRNPPQHVAELFREVLDDGFGGAFASVVFAILNDHNSPPGGNLAPFRRAFPHARCGELGHPPGEADSDEVDGNYPDGWT